MDPNARQLGVSFGQGGPLLGGPASQVLAQPGGISQQTPSSVSFNPGLFPKGPLDQMQPMNQIQPVGQPMSPQLPPQVPPQPPQSAQMQPQTPPPGMGTVGLPPSVPESTMILKSLINRLALHNKKEEALIPSPAVGTQHS